jgi:hypothetical protein
VNDAKNNSITFFKPEKLLDLEYVMSSKQELYNGKHIQLLLSLTIFDKIEKNILTIIEGKQEYKTSVCLSKNIFHNFVDKNNIHNLIAHNVTHELFEKFGYIAEFLEQTVLEKLNQLNYLLYVDKCNITRGLPTVNINITVGVNRQNLENNKLFDSNRYSWVNTHMLCQMKENFNLDDESKVVITAMNFTLNSDQTQFL